MTDLYVHTVANKQNSVWWVNPGRQLSTILLALSPPMGWERESDREK